MTEHYNRDLTVGELAGDPWNYPPAANPTRDTVVAYMREADPVMAMKVVNAPEETSNGRSRWFWLRTLDGDLMLACFPQGEMYFETEADHGRP